MISLALPPAPPVLMTHLDVGRLNGLLSSRVGVAYRLEASHLRQELRRATVIASQTAPSDLVTMNSMFVYEEDERGGAPKAVTLVYPWRAHERAVVSVFSSLGIALLGVRVGHSTCAVEPGSGEGRVLRVLSIAYQPEAAGHWHL